MTWLYLPLQISAGFWKTSNEEAELIKNSAQYFYFSSCLPSGSHSNSSIILWYFYEAFTLWLDIIALLMPVCQSCRQEAKGALSGRAENRWLSGNPVCPSIVETQSRESRECVCVRVRVHPTVPLPLGVSAFYKPPLICCRFLAHPPFSLSRSFTFSFFFKTYTAHRDLSWKPLSHNLYRNDKHQCTGTHTRTWFKLYYVLRSKIYACREAQTCWLLFIAPVLRVTQDNKRSEKKRNKFTWTQASKLQLKQSR